MEIVLIAVVAVAIGAFIYLNRSSKKMDVNNDGHVDLADVALAAKPVVEETKAVVEEVVQPKVEEAKPAPASKPKAKGGRKPAAMTAKAKEPAKKAAPKSRGRKPKAK